MVSDGDVKGKQNSRLLPLRTLPFPVNAGQSNRPYTCTPTHLEHRPSRLAGVAAGLAPKLGEAQTHELFDQGFAPHGRDADIMEEAEEALCYCLYVWGGIGGGERVCVLRLVVGSFGNGGQMVRE